jgi:hypothetical protein
VAGVRARSVRLSILYQSSPRQFFYLALAFAIAYCLLSVACCLLAIGYCLLPIVCCLLPIGYWLLPIACCLLAIGYWLFAIGYWYWLLAIVYWLLAIVARLAFFFGHAAVSKKKDRIVVCEVRLSGPLSSTRASG